MNAPTTAGTARRISGMCDVTGCSGQTYMGWRPDTAPRGRQVCESHWHRHRDVWDSFDLFEAFGFRRPAPKKKTSPLATCRVLSLKRLCPDCGQPRKPRHRYCDKCSNKRKAESNRKRQQRYRDEKRNAFVRPLAETVSCRFVHPHGSDGPLRASERILWRNCKMSEECQYAKLES